MYVGIVDYGLGNLNSVRNMLRKIGVKASISADRKVLSSCDTLILPGVGHFKKGMQSLRDRDLISTLHRTVEEGKLLIGICLGMQLLGSFSEEGDCEGLGFIDANFRRFDFKNLEEPLPVPHMGWNYVEKLQDFQFLELLPKPCRFYFVHSYFADQVSSEDILLTTHYGQRIVAAYKRKNVLGFQFHPEKSHNFGISLFMGLFGQGLQF
jgi:glutamine amidotransferase